MDVILLDLTGCGQLQSFDLYVNASCDLTLHGSFQQRQGHVKWLGNSATVHGERI